jgi:hypothetical protein
MEDPLLLYSTNTLLAYRIGRKYYGDEHYVWCTPHFDPRKESRLDATVPPSSSPAEIYRGLFEDVQRADLHSAKIEENRAGIASGVELKWDSGVISTDQAIEILKIVEAAGCQDFRPLLYVIPHALVKPMLREVPLEKRASLMSDEFVIDRLPRRFFDVLELPLGS